ncbi:transmembrane protein 16H [Thecamonas trahens ATCC 50062]|uniref:Transmembrane protein 16H n=1 Tax=Thecamonas trahens ATCC 50062 TaxID=461836 RepID=A0A0L0D570_THETB|nr:transmembrane protein 16H [Thecamonas trahens ATCC 50062]KNC46453.1 transmembrane protein 16H [Thecamonas trahens ATCC 50062]|eukprot:XP_013760744.1 transmembrane protein 16H [Thecamonas trahens ATCC 50062]
MPDLVDAVALTLRASGLIASRRSAADADEIMLAIDAPHMWLARAAEAASLKKALKDGALRSFVVARSEAFDGFAERTQFFTSKEKIQLLIDALECLLPGTDAARVASVPWSPSMPMVATLRKESLLLAEFPFHDDDALAALENAWLTRHLESRQPIDAVHEYYGAEIAFYFAWLEEYTRWLTVPAALGAVVFALTQTMPSAAQIGILVFAAFITLWGTCFLEAWKRRSAVLAYHWNVHEHEASEAARFQYTGELVTNPLTGAHERHFPWAARAARYAITIPVTVAAVIFAILVMLTSFAAEDALRGSHWTVRLIPLGLYGVFVPLFNMAYRKLAVVLNDYENHRTETQYKDSMIIKLASVQFVNCYVSLFYAAFVVRDLDRLTTQLTSLLFTSQILFGTLEVLTPAATKLYALWSSAKDLGSDHAPRIVSKARAEYGMPPYASVYDDYLEMVIQFGYITLFAAVLPLAPLLAFANNVVEIRADAYKLVGTSRRPVPVTVSDIGVWWTLLQVLSVGSVLTNVALVGFTSHGIAALTPTWSHAAQLGLLVAAEHALLALKYLLSVTIPNRPEWLEMRIQAEHARNRAFAADAAAAASRPIPQHDHAD